ncbi:prepilin peptidase [Acetobacteraceae bacterium]|nr:prepilin peptidase [Candidatus Parcubacteria bacterium]
MSTIFFILPVGVLLFGAIIGSFLNALSFRFNTGRSIANGRSRCMHCNHTLGILDLVPVFSYLLLRGRCRYCGTKISLQYPVVEIVAAGISLITYVTHPDPLAFFFWLLVWMILLFIVIYDLRHTIIPWSFSIPLLFLALLWVFIFRDPMSGSIQSYYLWALLAGPLLALPLFLISLVSGGRWMGWGDSMLELSLGLLLGLSVGASALMCAFWSGALVGIFLLFLKKGFKIRSEIPFAPFLAFGAFLAHTFNVDFFSSLPLLW